jgi:hypothetical protein
MSYNQNIQFALKSLSRRQDYSYKIVGLGGNWPAVAEPSSGTFTAQSGEEFIDTNIAFCNYTGVCPPDDPKVLGYSFGYNCGTSNNNIFTNVGLELTRVSDESKRYEPSILVEASGFPTGIAVELTHNDDSGNKNKIVRLNQNGHDHTEFMTKVTNLNPGSQYSYKVIDGGGNWPAQVITATGGNFTATGTEYHIPHKLHFCSSSNACPSTLPGFLPFGGISCADKSNIYRCLQVEISATDCSLYAGKTFHSEKFTAYCNNCLSRPTIATTANVQLSSSNAADISFSFNNLTPGRTYVYNFTNRGSTWPTILTPTQGTFIATDANYTTRHRILFCDSARLCPNGTPGLLGYTAYNYGTNLEKQMTDKLLHTTLAINLTDTSCDNETITSENVHIECNSCLPAFKYPNPQWASAGNSSIAGTTNKKDLIETCCNGTTSLSATVTNVYPGDAYTYTITSTNDKIQFVPNQGTVYFGTTTGLTNRINTIMSTTLGQNEMGIITIAVTHTDSSISAMDSLTITCDPTC